MVCYSPVGYGVQLTSVSPSSEQSIKRGVTLIIIYENILQIITTLVLIL